MKFSKLFYAVMMMFWVSFLGLLGTAVTVVPQGGLNLAGITLFANAGLIDALWGAMNVIGLSAMTQSVLLGILGGLNIGAAGLIVFALVFCIAGGEISRRDARSDALPLIEGATACVALACLLVFAISLGAGQAGILAVLEFMALGGVSLIVFALSQDQTAESDTALNMPVSNASPVFSPSPVSNQSMSNLSVLDDIIAKQAAIHVAFSAQVARLNRREPQS